MLSAGAGVAVHADGSTPRARRRAGRSCGAGTTAADLALVFAGGRHDHDEYVGVLARRARAIPRASIIGCSATGVLSADDELEDGRAVAVLVLADDGQGGPRLPRPLFIGGIRADARAAGARLGREVLPRRRRRRERRRRRAARRSRRARRRRLRRGPRRGGARGARHGRGRLGRRGGLPRLLRRRRAHRRLRRARLPARPSSRRSA